MPRAVSSTKVGLSLKPPVSGVDRNAFELGLRVTLSLAALGRFKKVNSEFYSFHRPNHRASLDNNYQINLLAPCALHVALIGNVFFPPTGLCL